MNQEIIRKSLHFMMEHGLKLDMKDPNIKDTPKRIAKMYCEELFANLNEDFPEESFSLFPNEKNYSQIVMMDNVHFTSVCSHHFLPFSGKAWFLYIPDKHLVGISKIPRIIQHYSSRPQLQENLCHEIMKRFSEVVEPIGAMLVMRAIHGCIACRGANQYANSGMTSSVLYGSFKDEATRLEGLDLIKMSTALI